MYEDTLELQSPDASATIPCKTPVSLLQELCMRRGTSPGYELLQIQGAVHEPTFEYSVTVGQFTATGSGLSKKKAKHAAAKALLDIIIADVDLAGPTTEDDGTSIPGAMPEVAESKAAVMSAIVVPPNDDDILGNPIGKLQEECVNRKWLKPTYEETAEDGPPHDRVFTITCTIATHRAVGIGKSKKLAKRQAAHNMLQKLPEMPREQLTSDDEQDETLELEGGRAEDLVIRVDSPLLLEQPDDLLLIPPDRNDILSLDLSKGISSRKRTSSKGKSKKERDNYGSSDGRSSSLFPEDNFGEIRYGNTDLYEEDTSTGRASLFPEDRYSDNQRDLYGRQEERYDRLNTDVGSCLFPQDNVDTKNQHSRNDNGYNNDGRSSSNNLFASDDNRYDTDGRDGRASDRSLRGDRWLYNNIDVYGDCYGRDQSETLEEELQTMTI